MIEAGGKSTRMGMDKALMPFNGEPLIQRIIRRLDGVGDEMMIVANQPEPYRMLGLRVVPDVIPGSGALSGVHTALACASHPFVIITACDLPFVNAHLIREAMRHL
ncbi:MAG: molybdenum cofactor guanylyltransferase, partial [Longilinea sp.]|nr:molybdenum cofactor guanylyltransferase [Longilinea sp.]